MKFPVARLALPWILLLLALSAVAPMRADDVGYSSLTICNSGSIPFNVVVAMDNEPLPATHRWNVYAWIDIEPKSCKKVHHSSFGPPAYIGFGYYDAQKRFGAGIIDEVPNVGFLEYNWVQAAMYGKSKVPVLTKANKRLCVKESSVSYTLNDSPETNCSALHPQGSTRPYFAFLATLFFQPMASRCSDGKYGIPVTCYGGHYYLNVVASPNSWHMTATPGSESDSGADPPAADSGPTFGDVVKEMLENSRKQQAYEAAERKRKEKAAAEEAVARRKRLEADAAAGDYNAQVTLKAWQQYEQQGEQQWKAPHYSVGAYDPQWMGRTVVFQGTVARVDRKSDSHPEWTTIYFKESPDGTVTVCTPSPSIFTAVAGSDFSGMIGKKIEVAGQVEHKYCPGKASIRVLESRQWQMQ